MKNWIRNLHLWHTWTNWQDTLHNDLDYFSENYYFQSRSCIVCNLRQTSKVRARG